jgi:exoribonuclease R
MLAGHVFEESGLRAILDWINYRERLIDQLQRLYVTWKLVAGGGIAIGDTWDVTVTRVVRAGVYYLYVPLMMDGFIHVSALSRADAPVRWSLTDDGEGLVSDCGEQVLRVGSVVRCTVESVDAIKCTYTLHV